MPFGMSTAQGDTALSLNAAGATVSSGPIAAAGQAGYVLAPYQVKTMTGTSPTITVSLDESNDGSAWTAMTGATSGAVSAPGSGVVFGRPTKQYVRVTATIGGTTPAVTAEVAAIVFAD
jgi:hypothetical protein